MADGDDRGGKRKPRKKNDVDEANGRANVKATFNNVIVTLTDEDGNTISRASAGKMGFKGSSKNTHYDAQKAGESAANEAYELGLRRVDVYVKGPGSGREGAIRAMSESGLEVASIRDVTPLPHNGCRPPKRRRV